jgi:hypothetical protein
MPASSPAASTSEAASRAGRLHVLGPQRPATNVPRCLADVPGDGPVVLVSAGWRIEETDAPEVLSRLGLPVVHLPLYAWHEQLRGQAPSVEIAWRARQDRILALKQLYQLRLRHLLDGLVALRSLAALDRQLYEVELDDAVRDVRRLDAHLLEVMAEIHEAYPEAAASWEHPAVGAFRAEAQRALADARCVLVAGGNVGVLRNRLQYFGLGPLLAETVDRGASLVAWSAGAMALSERIVLYYDDPPEGPAWPELFDRGLGLLPDAVFLPHARQRLRLSDAARVALMASRFGPSPCIGLEVGAWLTWDGQRWQGRGEPSAAFALGTDGQTEPWTERNTAQTAATGVARG